MALPPTVTVPLSVMSPAVAVAERLPPTLDVFRRTPSSLVMVASPLAPAVLTAMVPSTASWLSTMVALLAVVLKLALPATDTVPVLEMPLAPPLVTFRSPLAVRADRATLAALKLIVTSSRAVAFWSEPSELKAELLRSDRSRTRPWLPPMVMAPPRLLPLLPSRMSDAALSTVRVTAPPVVSVAPTDCVMWLPEVMLSEPPTLEVASTTSCVLSLAMMTLAPEPLVLTAKVPVTFCWSTVIEAPEATVV